MLGTGAFKLHQCILQLRYINSVRSLLGQCRRSFKTSQVGGRVQLFEFLPPAGEQLGQFSGRAIPQLPNRIKSDLANEARWDLSCRI